MAVCQCQDELFVISVTRAASCVPSGREGGTLAVLVVIQQALSDCGHFGGNCMHHLLQPHLHVLPTQCIYVFCVDLRTNSDYFPIQH